MDHLLDGFAGDLMTIWYRRKQRIESDFAITGWIVSVLEPVRADVKARMNGEHRDAVERVVAKMLMANDAGIGDPRPVEIVLNEFWEQFKHFQNKTGKYDNAGRWKLPAIKAGKSAQWHELYSLPYYRTFGTVACRVASKILGIGPAERAWGDVKHLHTDKRVNISAKRVEKQAILYTTARISEARVRREARESTVEEDPEQLWGDEGIK